MTWSGSAAIAKDDSQVDRVPENRKVCLPGQKFIGHDPNLGKGGSTELRFRVLHHIPQRSDSVAHLRRITILTRFDDVEDRRLSSLQKN
jgi:hypothetical protein